MYRIQKQILDLNYYQETGVDQFYDKTLHLFYQDLKPEIERILDKHIPNDLLIDISELTVDLGTTYESELRTQWMQKFPGAFEDALLKKIKLIKDGLGFKGESIKSLTTNKLDILLFFLAEGTLPWSATHEEQNINVLFDELLLKHAPDVNKRFRSEAISGKMIQRLVLQFTDRQIENLTNVIQPSESNFIIQTSVELRQRQQQDQFVKAGSNEFRNAIWIFILTYLIDERGSYFNTREFMRALLHKMSVKFHIEYGLLIQEIFKSIKRLKLDPVKFRLGLLLSEIYEIDIPKQTLTLEQVTERKLIIDYLILGKHKRSKTEINEPDFSVLLINWIKHSPLDVQDFLYKNKNKTVLKRITEILAEEELLLVVQVIAPVEIKFVADFTKEIRKQQKEQNWVQSSNTEFRNDLWTAILDILLNDRGSHFNQKIFTLSTLENLAKHYSLSTAFFIEQILKLIEQQKILTKASSLWKIFFEIKKELADKKKKQPISQKIKTESYFQFLNSLLRSSDKRDQHQISNLIFDKSETLKFLILKEPKRLKDWIIKNLQTIEQASLFIHEIDLKEVQFLIKILNPSFAKQLIQVKELFSENNLRVLELQEIELYQHAFTHLISSTTTSRLFESFIISLIEKLARNKNIEKTEIAGLILENSKLSSPKLPQKALNFLIKTYQLALTTKETSQKLRNKTKEISTDKANITTRTIRVDPKPDNFIPLELKRWQQEISKLITVKELDKWMNEKLKTIASNELTKLKQLISLYFKQWQKVKSTNQHIPGIKFDKIISAISLNDLPFLHNYLTDLELLYKYSATKFKGISSSWIKSRIIDFWSHTSIVAQTELTAFLIHEISLKTSIAEMRIKELLLKNANALNRKLLSTIILDLSKEEIVKGTKNESQSIEKTKKTVIPEPKKMPMKPQEEDEEVNTQYISNSGLVLLNPFIPSLFVKTGLLNYGKFINEDKKNYGTHLLQFCVNNLEGQAEHLLTLPKILSGIDLSEPINNNISIKEEDKKLAQSLLRAIINQWSALGNTSPEGFQQSFIQRNGALRLLEDRYELEIEQRAYDLLIDRIPWTFSLIKYQWMTKPIYTKWR